MVRAMTRAEYEMEFGVAPVLPTGSNIDTTPAPRRMTRAEYDAEFGVKNKGFLSSTEPSFKASMGGASSIAPNLAKTVGNIPSSARNLVRFTAEPVNPLDTEGSMNIGANVAKSGFALKDIFQNRGISGLKDIAGGIADTAKKGFNLWKGAGESIYKNLEERTLEQDSVKKGVGVSTAETVSNIAKIGIEDPLLLPSIAYGGKSITKAGKVTDAISDLARPITRGVDTSLSGMASKVRTARASQTSKLIEEELYKIENNYSNTRKLNEFQPDSGADSRKRISQTDVLAGSVDENGVIRTKQPGGAVDRYRAQTIEGKEAVVRENLVREGAKVNLAEVEREMMIEMDKVFEGEDLTAALNGIKREIQGLTRRADEFGDVSLEKVHDAKINTTRHIDYNTPAETKAYRKAKARVYKKIVEDKSKFQIDVDGKKVGVREINKELSKYYKDIEHLEMLDGKRVKGGKLGKYTAQITGNIVGGAIGGAVGGLPGTAIGAVVGGETSSYLKGQSLAGTFGKERGMPVVKNPILERAAIEGKLPPKADLTIPSPRVGAPRKIPKTPEITKIESQIARNVAAQKAAIKAGNFTLVAKLKEVYNALVEKLKSMIKLIKENSQAGFIKNPLAQTSKSDIPQPGKLSQLPQSSNDITTGAKEVQGGGVDNLLSEARKYKSAEEFVVSKGKAVTDTLYDTKKEILKALKKGDFEDWDTINDELRNVGINTTNLDNAKAILERDIQLTDKMNKEASQLTDIWNKANQVTKEVPAYKGEKDLTTKILKDLEGKTTVSKQYILDATNRGELKQVERDLIRKILDESGDTSPLAQEARKYKSAEEFVKAQDDLPVKEVGFHGTQAKEIRGTPNKTKGTMGNAFYLADSPDEALKFGTDKGVVIGGNKMRVSGAFQQANKFTFDLSDLKIKRFKNDAEFFDFVKDPDIEKWFRLAGYDGAYITRNGNYAIYNTEKLKQIPTKSQLTDIWKKVQSSDTINVSDFAKKVKAELLPLKVKEPSRSYNFETGRNNPMYENIALPDELRGKVKNYKERIYESPIKTSAGQTHFGSNSENYFGHTRIEDMADNKTRRVIEVQSDLYQKGNLEKEIESANFAQKGVENADKKLLTKAELSGVYGKEAKNLQKLQQYNDPTAHFRMVREEIKKAAQDGKTKLQFPTGETAMKIEGLGDNTNWYDNSIERVNGVYPRLKADQIKVGMEVRQDFTPWIITNVLGDGKFKAVPKSEVTDYMGEGFSSESDLMDAIRKGENLEDLETVKETFDISGKVDTNNPIYKFYEKDMQKYLSKFDGKRIVDDKGVSWIEIPIKKEWAKMPVEAFALIGGIGLAASQNK